LAANPEEDSDDDEDLLKEFKEKISGSDKLKVKGKFVKLV
jgi:hypothetical protein